ESEWSSVEQDIQDLLLSSENYSFASNSDYGPRYTLDNEIEFQHCKSWFSKRFRGTQRFIKKHKKALIVGAVVVVAVVAIVATAGTSSPALAPAAGLAGGAAGSKNSKNGHSSKTPTNSDIAPKQNSSESLAFSEALKEHISEFQSSNAVLSGVKESSPPTIAEKARQLGAHFAHKTFEDISEFVSIAPALYNEIQSACNFGSDGFERNDLMKDPIESYQKLLAKGHEKIDTLFATNQAANYTPEAKKGLWKENPICGTLPLPGALGFGSRVKTCGQLAMTDVNTLKGWKLGNPINNLTKAGNRPSWSAVRRRYWKNQAYFRAKELDIRNLNRMKRGLARQVKNELTGKWESIELHHAPSQKNGGLFDFVEVTPEQHAAIDPNRRLGG
ncbi:MAG: hypothetical protein KDK44_00470, partial [Chlamydiia bacterium]|nr:hypothetical protein [Chlamydiia bacterium]